MKHLPNFITSLNLTSGFIAIIFAANGNIVFASWLIVAAMIFDFLDGFSARLLKAYSAIGKELDSLADVVSFGVAPAVIIYHLMATSVLPNASLNTSVLKPVLLMLVPAVMATCAALRLAIFNIDPLQTTSFKGLPTPANAIAVISLVISGQYSHAHFSTYVTGSPVLLALFTLILSLLMVSRMPLLSLKITNLNLKGNEGRYILAGLLIIDFVIFGTMALPLIIPLYIIASLLSLLF